MKSIPIKQYRDFWDVPRIFLALKDDYLLLFDCKFNEEKDDYEEEYKVFIMPELSNDEISGSWHQLSEKAIKCLGKIFVNEVKFDGSKRKFIKGKSVFETFDL